jgi:hypothetical protein
VGTSRLAAARGSVRLDGFESAVLGLFAVLSLWVLALNLWQVVAHGRVWTGTDGVFVVDQLQYMAWVQDASRHVLVSNLFVLHSTPSDFFQPAIVLSGALTAMGVPAWLSLLLWKPVAVGSIFYAVRSYVGRMLPSGGAARAALVLGLFFGSYTIIYGSAGTIGDLFLPFLSWGYVFSLLSLACLIATLITYDRLRADERLGWLPGGLGALASVVHPWHGEILVLTLLVAEAMLLRRGVSRRRLELLVITVVMTAAPLIYYELLGRLDLSWKLARVASKHSFPLTWILLALVPLLLPAAISLVRRPAGFLEATTRAWLIAALLVYVASASALQATPLHAFQGATIPLAVLAVDGCRRVGWSRMPHHGLAAVVLIAAFCISTTVDEFRTARSLVAPRSGHSDFVTHDEQRALDYLADDPTPGGVITRSYLGLVVPGDTGRHTFVGDCLWSEPNCPGRLVAVRKLFTGGMSQETARAFVRGSHARFLLADCRPNTDLVGLLGPVIRSTRTFGCARVYEVQ